MYSSFNPYVCVFGCLVLSGHYLMSPWDKRRSGCKPNFLSHPSASIQKMVPRQAAVPWIRRRVLGWCSTLHSPRASAGSPSCTARTQTMTRPPKPCHVTPPSTVKGKHEAIILDTSRGGRIWNMFYKSAVSTHSHVHAHARTHKHTHMHTCTQSTVSALSQSTQQ